MAGGEVGVFVDAEPYDAERFQGRPSALIVRRARELRQSTTSGEQLLWEFVRARRLHGRKFRRQHPLGRFIADFFCDDARLIVEIDGAIHQEPTQQERDRLREETLQRNALRVLRFTNDEIMNRTEQALHVLSSIVHHYTHEHTDPSDSPSPAAPGEGGGG